MKNLTSPDVRRVNAESHPASRAGGFYPFMKAYTTDKIRNVGLFSHGGGGKTSLAEALLFTSKAVNRLGRVDDGSTVMDYDPDEQKRHISVQLSVAPVEWNDTKINVIDVPG